MPVRLTASPLSPRNRSTGPREEKSPEQAPVTSVVEVVDVVVELDVLELVVDVAPRPSHAAATHISSAKRA